MLRSFVLAAGALTMVAGFAMAQEVQQTTTQAQTTTPAAPDINSQAADAQAKARAQAKPGEEYEWSVDSTTTHVPVHPTVTEKKTTTTNVAPLPMMEHRRTQTTTTTQGGDQ